MILFSAILCAVLMLGAGSWSVASSLELYLQEELYGKRETRNSKIVAETHEFLRCEFTVEDGLLVAPASAQNASPIPNPQPVEGGFFLKIEDEVKLHRKSLQPEIVDKMLQEDAKYAKSNQTLVTNTHDYPYNSIGQVASEFSNALGIGSAAVVTGEGVLRCLITAAHNVVHPIKGYATSILFSAGRCVNHAIASSQARGYFINTEWKEFYDQTKGDRDWDKKAPVGKDFAIIVLREELPEVLSMNILPLGVFCELKEEVIHVGYPCIDTVLNGKRMQKQSVSLTTTLNPAKYQKGQFYPGHSGGPVYKFVSNNGLTMAFVSIVHHGEERLANDYFGIGPSLDDSVYTLVNEWLRYVKESL